MAIGSILIILVIFGLVIAVITRPLHTLKPAKSNEAQQSSDQLQAEYQQTLNHIRELEQDFLEGKIVNEDYLTYRDQLNKKAVAYLQNLESNSNKLMKKRKSGI